MGSSPSSADATVTSIAFGTRYVKERRSGLCGGRSSLTEVLQ